MLAVCFAGNFFGKTNHRREEVAFEIAVFALQHRRDALQAHAGVNARLGQRRQIARFVAVELHEHEIPEFQIAVAVALADAAIVAAAHCFALIYQNFRAGAARAGVAH